jgi:cytochrome c-type biogenesis protein CcmH
MRRPDVRRGAVVLGAMAVVAFAAAIASSGRSLSAQDEATRIAAGMRCPVCTAQSVAESESPAAQEMRGEIERQLAAGRTEAEIRASFVARYGPEILLMPPARGVGLLARLAALLAFVIGCLLLWFYARRRRSEDARPRSASPPAAASEQVST